MKAISVVSLVLMLTVVVPAHAQDQREARPLNVGAGGFSVCEVAVIAISALIGGAATYLIADWLFFETAEVTTTLGGSHVMAVSDAAEHSGIIVGSTIAGGVTGAILGSLIYDYAQADVENW